MGELDNKEYMMIEKMCIQHLTFNTLYSLYFNPPHPQDNNTHAVFFSSRRRHTIFSRDWSSDVCSSDLAALDPLDVEESQKMPGRRGPARGGPVRSEERRVGKEGRSGLLAGKSMRVL